MHPILISIGRFMIRTNQVVVALGLIASIGMLLKNTKRKKLSLDFLERHFLLVTFVTFIAARLGYALKEIMIYGTNWRYALISALQFWNDSWSFFSGVTAFFAILLYLVYRHDRENLTRWFDVITMPILTLLLFSHIGDFFEGINYGSPSQAPWAITVENILVQYTVPIHPTQIYATIYTGTIMFLIRQRGLLDKIMPESEDRMFIVTATLYSLGKFFEEFVRGDIVATILGIRMGQIVSLGVFLGLVWLIKKRRQKPASLV